MIFQKFISRTQLTFEPYAGNDVSGLVGLGVWFALRVREVPGSIPGQAQSFKEFHSFCWGTLRVYTLLQSTPLFQALTFNRNIQPNINIFIAGAAVCELSGLAASHWSSLRVNSWYNTYALLRFEIKLKSKIEIWLACPIFWTMFPETLTLFAFKYDKTVAGWLLAGLNPQPSDHLTYALQRRHGICWCCMSKAYT